MISIKAIKNNLLSLQSLTNMAGTYEEIAAIRMRKIKQTVVKNREFLEGLNDLYFKVSDYAQNYKKALIARQPSKKNICVLLSSNTGLYGDIIQNIFDKFVQDIRGSNADVVVIGRIGKKLVDGSSLNINYRYFDLNDNVYDKEMISDILRYVLDYKNIVVYHGLFKSILVQSGYQSFITGDAEKIRQERIKLTREHLMVIFEPTPEEVAKFFEDQILSILFEQTIYENNLSKYASRMISLDFSIQKAEKQLIGLDLYLKKAIHRQNNKKQQIVMSGVLICK